MAQIVRISDDSLSEGHATHTNPPLFEGYCVEC